mmetsp:Transcript_36226/g.94944  ORF Transcript_36226/g.94944 Transcript_36226/m.94944 type:complete len:259 (-) Transcript_36226:2488-3264(-)
MDSLRTLRTRCMGFSSQSGGLMLSRCRRQQHGLNRLQQCLLEPRSPVSSAVYKSWRTRCMLRGLWWCTWAQPVGMRYRRSSVVDRTTYAEAPQVCSRLGQSSGGTAKTPATATPPRPLRRKAPASHCVVGCRMSAPTSEHWAKPCVNSLEFQAHAGASSSVWTPGIWAVGDGHSIGRKLRLAWMVTGLVRSRLTRCAICCRLQSGIIICGAPTGTITTFLGKTGRSRAMASPTVFWATARCQRRRRTRTAWSLVWATH